MSGFDISLALMVPNTLREQANLLACALGHDSLPGNTFSVGLSPDGTQPATHWVCHSWVQESFVATLAGAAKGNLPSVAWEDFGLREADVWEVFAGLVASEPSATPLDFDAWVAAYDLKRVESSEAA